MKYRYDVMLAKGDKVKVYRNLHVNAYSVVALTGEHKGKVVAHAETINLKNAFTKVSEAGRLKVIKEKRKNVHAYVVGEYAGDGVLTMNTARAISYNPYKRGEFYYKDNDATFNGNVNVALTPTGMLAAA